MSGKNPLDKLIRAVANDPRDTGSIIELIHALLDAGRPAEAAEYFADLQNVLPQNDPSLLEIGEKVAAANGDHLQAARYRKLFREFLEENKDVDEDDDDWDDQPHPSHAELEQLLTQPRLRLLSGGGEDDRRRHAPKHHLRDIAGLATVKRNVEEILDSIRAPKGPGWLGGTLFYGPPNCGKAFLSEVIASELGAIVWAFDFSQEWHAHKLRLALQQAIDDAQNNPVLIYMDHVDREVNRRTLEKTSILETLDTACNAGGQVSIIGAATLPWLTTPQVVRSGRLGRVLLVLPPDPPARRDFLQERLSRYEGVSNEEMEWIVKHTEGYSFGDLDRLIATTVAISPTFEHVAVRKARQEVGPSSADWLNTAGHHALMNESGGMYDDLLRYFHKRERIK